MLWAKLAYTIINFFCECLPCTCICNGSRWRAPCLYQYLASNCRLLCRFDAIFVARKAVMESVLPLLKLACPSVPIIFDTVDVHFVRETRQVRRLLTILLHRCLGL